MALIKCPECGHDISDKAERCINCGMPISTLKYSNGDANANNKLHLEFYYKNSSWILDGDIIKFNQKQIQIKDIEFATMSEPTFSNKYIMIKYYGENIMLPFHDGLEGDARTALKYIIQKSRCSSPKYSVADLSEVRLRCNVCKKIFCVQGNMQSLNGVSCPSCNSMNVTLLENIDIPDTTLNVISFLIPIIGLVLYLVKREETPNKAKKIGEWALIGFIVGIFLWAIILDL